MQLPRHLVPGGASETLVQQRLALLCEMALLLDGVARGGAVRYLGFVYATGKTCDHALLLARTVLENQRLQHNAVQQYSWRHWVSHLP